MTFSEEIPAPLDEGLACYNLAYKVMREQGVRSGKFDPITDDERRWAGEGPRCIKDLDTVRVVNV